MKIIETINFKDIITTADTKPLVHQHDASNVPIGARPQTKDQEDEGDEVVATKEVGANWYRPITPHKPAE